MIPPPPTLWPLTSLLLLMVLVLQIESILQTIFTVWAEILLGKKFTKPSYLCIREIFFMSHSFVYHRFRIFSSHSHLPALLWCHLCLNQRPQYDRHSRNRNHYPHREILSPPLPLRGGHRTHLSQFPCLLPYKEKGWRCILVGCATVRFPVQVGAACVWDSGQRGVSREQGD